MIFWIDMVGWAASATVLATFCMNTMMPLRVLAIISNVLFCAFGAIGEPVRNFNQGDFSVGDVIIELSAEQIQDTAALMMRRTNQRQSE
jgi:hypothetical protein